MAFIKTDGESGKTELFELIDVTAESWEVFQTKKSIGTYSKEELENKKLSLTNQVWRLDEQIALFD